MTISDYQNVPSGCATAESRYRIIRFTKQQQCPIFVPLRSLSLPQSSCGALCGEDDYCYGFQYINTTKQCQLMSGRVVEQIVNTATVWIKH